MCSVDDVSGVVEEREILLVLVYGQGIITLAGINGDLVVAGSYSIGQSIGIIPAIHFYDIVASISH